MQTEFSRATGYGSQAVRTDRDTEYAVVSRVTRNLRDAQAAGDGQALIAAIHKNNELWTILATDLAHDANGLPDQLKAGLLSLAFFSLRHGHAALEGKTGVAPLIDVNLSIMKGLRGEVAA